MKQLSTRTISFISLIAITFLALGVFAIQRVYNTPLPIAEDEKTETQEKNEKTITETIDTSNWKTFRNEEYGYEVNYPQDWIKKDGARREVSFNSPRNEEYFQEVKKGNGDAYAEDITIFYYDSVADERENRDNPSIAETLDELIKNNPLITPIEKTTLAGEDVWFVVRIGYDAYFSALLVHEGHLYEIFFGNSRSKNDLSKEERDILNSFSFSE